MVGTIRWDVKEVTMTGMAMLIEVMLTGGIKRLLRDDQVNNEMQTIARSISFIVKRNLLIRSTDRTPQATIVAKIITNNIEHIGMGITGNKCVNAEVAADI